MTKRTSDYEAILLLGFVIVACSAGIYGCSTIRGCKNCHTGKCQDLTYTVTNPDWHTNTVCSTNCQDNQDDQIPSCTQLSGNGTCTEVCGGSWYRKCDITRTEYWTMQVRFRGGFKQTISTRPWKTKSISDSFTKVNANVCAFYGYPSNHGFDVKSVTLGSCSDVVPECSNVTDGAFAGIIILSILLTFAIVIMFVVCCSLREDLSREKQKKQEKQEKREEMENWGTLENGGTLIDEGNYDGEDDEGNEGNDEGELSYQLA